MYKKTLNFLLLNKNLVLEHLRAFIRAICYTWRSSHNNNLILITILMLPVSCTSWIKKPFSLNDIFCFRFLVILQVDVMKTNQLMVLPDTWCFKTTFNSCHVKAAAN